MWLSRPFAPRSGRPRTKIEALDDLPGVALVDSDHLSDDLVVGRRMRSVGGQARATLAVACRSRNRSLRRARESSHASVASRLDALTQLIEPFVSAKANPMTDAICREGIRHAARSLRGAYHNGSDKSARESMSLASLFGGMALANAALGAVHGFAGPLGGMIHAPHGELCARLLPLVMEANIKALQERQPENIALQRYVEIAQIVTENKNAIAEDGVKWVSDLVDELKIPSLSTHGMNESHIPEAVQKTLNANSFKGNPIALNEEEFACLHGH